MTFSGLIDKQKGLSKQFTQKIRSKVHFLCIHPKAGIIRYGNTKTAVLDVIPYMIHYTVDEKQEL